MRIWIFVLGMCCAAVVTAQPVTFLPPLTSPTMAAPTAMATGDFNDDGNADLAVSDAGSHVISILLGKGDGTFQAAATYPVANGCVAGSLIVADFHASQKLDLLAVCEAGSQVYVYPGRGDGTFGTAVATQLPGLAFAGSLIFFPLGVGAVVADFNGDGKPDLVILVTPNFTSLAPQVKLLLGNGDGTFGAPATIASGTAALAMAAGDFDGDHKTDLALLTISGLDNSGNSIVFQALSIQLGNGDGTFRAGASYSWRGASFTLAAADLNGDGNLDLVAAGLSLTNLQGQVPATQVTVMLGDGKGNFKPSFDAMEPQFSLTVGFCLANLHGGSATDLLEFLLTGDASGQNISIALGTRNADGKGGFGSLNSTTVVPLSIAFAAACGDFNGDGLTDAAYTGILIRSVPSLFNPNFSLDTLQQVAQLVAEFPAGTLYVSTNSTPQKLTFTNANGASFANGPIAQNSIATAFWNGPAKTTGIGVNVTDAAGTTRPAQIFYASSKQINYAIPDGTAVGNATIAITGTPATFTSQQQIVAVAPGVFNAAGLAVGGTVTVHNGQQIPGNLVEPDASGNLQPVPIDVGTGSDQVFLVLYGTGIRNHAQPVTAAIGSTAAPVLFAGAQGTFVDEDQINVQVPQSLRGAGTVKLSLNVDGQTTNEVEILIQ